MYIVLLQCQTTGDDETQIQRECFPCATEDEANSLREQIADDIVDEFHNRMGMDYDLDRESMYDNESIFIDIYDAAGDWSYQIHVIEGSKYTGKQGLRI